MSKSSISQTDDLRTLLKILEQDVPAYLEPLPSNGTHGPSLKTVDSVNSITTWTGVADGPIRGPKQRIIHTCEKIVALLQGPIVKLSIDASGHLTSAAISIALKLRLPQLISSDVNSPTTLGELVKATTASPDLLSRHSGICYYRRNLES